MWLWVRISNIKRPQKIISSSNFCCINIDVDQVIKSFREHQPKGLIVNSGLYPGWIDHWTDKHSTAPVQSVVNIDWLKIDLLIECYVDMNVLITVRYATHCICFSFDNWYQLSVIVHQKRCDDLSHGLYDDLHGLQKESSCSPY